MKDSNLNAVRPIIEAADIEQSKRIGTRFEAILHAEDGMTVDTGMFAISSIVGWFASTLETDEDQNDFERLMEMQFAAAAELRKEEQASS